MSQLINQSSPNRDISQPPRLVAHRDAVSVLRDLVEQGGYGAGDRLPAERELIDRLGIKRSALRKALDKLEQEGAIWRHVGKGTFVSGPPAPSDGGVGVGVATISEQLTPVKMMRARLSIEPAIAREAAINASGEAVARLRLAMERAAKAPNWAAYEAEDDNFHHAIAQAADNILLVSLFERLNQVQRAVAWNTVVRGTTRPPDGHTSFAEHRRIADAIEARDPAQAYGAMRDHIGSVSARLFGEM